MRRNHFITLTIHGVTGALISTCLASTSLYESFSKKLFSSRSSDVAANASDIPKTTGNYCESGTIISQGMVTGWNGATYASAFDFTHGIEKVNPNACGREYLIQSDPSKPYYRTKFVYLVNGNKNRVSSTLYIEQSDGSLQVFQDPNANTGKVTTSPSSTGTITSLDDGSGITNNANSSRNAPNIQTNTQVIAPSTTATTTTADSQTAITTTAITSELTTTGEQARSADAFVNSLGINTHLQYVDTPYGNFSGLIKPRLQELGVRHIRDSAYQVNSFFDKIRELGSVGIKSNLMFSGNSSAQILSTVRTLKGSIEAVEGPNETDLGNKFPYNGQVFPQSTRSYQNYLYSTIKNNADTKYLTVVMPAMGWAKRALDVGYLSSGDVGNMHSYPNLGNPPTDGLDWWFIPYGRTIVGNTKPLWSTETGYQTLVGSALGVSEKVAGKYIPRVWLEQFNSGIQRIYMYELLDEHPDPYKKEPEEHYGLLRHDGSRKPAFITIRNMIMLLKEPGANFTPGRLNYTITGDTTNLHHTLLQKSNGEFYLILWQETKSWDNTKKVEINVPLRRIYVNLNTSFSQASVYKPFMQSDVIWQYSNPQKVTLDVRDHPLILKLKP